jgi:hypothetical protein
MIAFLILVAGPAAEIALKTAARSAQMVKPKEIFSTLHPEKTWPSVVSMQQPTANLLYGEYEFKLACLASSINFLWSFSDI